jgi:(p)ppGpp synthase/HD superfamily hydrolase
MLTERFDEALAYASAAHRTQPRKGTDIPYVSHLLGVCSLALEAGADEDQAIAALLHDAVEDQGGADRLTDIRKRFGDRVAKIVADCTDSWTEPKPEWRQRKEAYLESLSHKSPDSLLVSLADKTHNASAINADLAVHGDELWSRFTGGREGSLWYYDSLARAFEERLPGPAAIRFRELVDEMHALASRPSNLSVPSGAKI